MKWTAYIALLLITLICACSDDPVTPRNSLVLEGYIFADAPIDRIKLSRLGGFGEGSVNTPVNDALVAIVNNQQVYVLQNDPAQNGNYFYPGNDLQITQGQFYEIFVFHEDDTLRGATTVPPKPTGLITGPALISASNPDAQITAIWDAIEGQPFWSPVIISLETDPVRIPGTEELRFSFSVPTTNEFFVIDQPKLTWYGQNALIVYSVNNEYVQLFDADNPENFFESPTNIVNGFGIFTAFNSDSVAFQVLP